jgi:hypothetical protein
VYRIGQKYNFKVTGIIQEEFDSFYTVEDIFMNQLQIPVPERIKPGFATPEFIQGIVLNIKKGIPAIEMINQFSCD